MTWDTLGQVGLAACGAAWLLTVAILILDLLGRRPARFRRNGSTQRPLGIAVLGWLTGVILIQVAELASWPRALRKGSELLAILSVFAYLASFIGAARARRTARTKTNRQTGSLRNSGLQDEPTQPRK